MIVSTKGRYALRVMVRLALNRDDGYIPLKEIAEAEGISQKYLEAIMTTLSKADQIIVLDKGRIAEMGTPAELEKAGGLYQKIYEIQSLSKEEVEA